MSQSDMWPEQPVRPEDTHTDNEGLKKTERIVLGFLQTQSTYDPAVFISDDHFAAHRIARHIHQHFDLRQSAPTPQAAVQGDEPNAVEIDGFKMKDIREKIVDILRSPNNKNRHPYRSIAENIRQEKADAILELFTAKGYPTKSSGELEEILLNFRKSSLGGEPDPQWNSRSNKHVRAALDTIIEAISSLHTTQTTKLQAEARLDELSEMKKHMISTSPFIDQILQPRIDVLESKLSELEREHKIGEDGE